MQNDRLTRGAIRFGAFELDLCAGELRKQGVKIKLQEQPFQILAMLLEQPGQVVTREELRSRLWPSDTFVDFDHSLNKAINKLREALGDSADSPRFIETLAKRGYRFLGDLKGSPGRIQSLLVLPIENLSRDPEQEYFADGLTEELITKLARIGSLRVLSRTTAMHYKGVRKPLPEIARELQVDGVVEGTVLRSGERVRISAQLVHAPTDTHLWAESYDRDLRDILALDSEVAQAIAREIQVKLTPEEQIRLARGHTVNPEAYVAYLKGRYHWNKRTLEGMSKGVQYFQQAIDRDPLYAAAHAGLADSASRLGFWGHVRPEEGCLKAKSAASKALEIDGTLADAHTALAWSLLHYDWSFLAAEKECRHAVELDPRSALAAQALCCCLMAMTRLEEGVSEAMRAAQLEPLSLAMQWTAGAMLYHARQFDRAIVESRKCLELDQTFPPPRWTIALSLLHTRSDDTGIPELENAIEATDRNQFFMGALGYCYAIRQRKEDALKVLGQLEEISKQRYVSPYWHAVIRGALGEKDEAFRLLEAAYRERSVWMVYVKVAPFFDPLRSDPRFPDLLGRMNFPP